MYARHFFRDFISDIFATSCSIFRVCEKTALFSFSLWLFFSFFLFVQPLQSRMTSFDFLYSSFSPSFSLLLLAILFIHSLSFLLKSIWNAEQTRSVRFVFSSLPCLVKDRTAVSLHYSLYALMDLNAIAVHFALFAVAKRANRLPRFYRPFDVLRVSNEFSR